MASNSGSKRDRVRKGPRPPSHAPYFPTKSWRPGLHPSDPEFRRLPEEPHLKCSPLTHSSKPPSLWENQMRSSSDASAGDEFLTSDSFDSQLQDSNSSFKTPGLLPLFTRVELLEMPTEQLLREMSITDDFLEQNMQRQNQIVKQRLSDAQDRLRSVKQWEVPAEERFRGEGAVPPPRWPDLGPSSHAPPPTGSLSSMLSRSLSSPQILAAGEKVSKMESGASTSTYEPEELFGWMRSLYEPSRPQAVLRRVLAPLPQPAVRTKKVKSSPSKPSADVSLELPTVAVLSPCQTPHETPTGAQSPRTAAGQRSPGNRAGASPPGSAPIETPAAQSQEEKDALEAKRKHDAGVAARGKAKLQLLEAVKSSSLDESLRRSRLSEEEKKKEAIAAVRKKAKTGLIAASISGSLTPSLKHSKLKQAAKTKSGHLVSMQEKREDALKSMYPDEAAEFEHPPSQSSNLDIDRNKCLSAWKRMSDGGELPTNELISLLSLAGQKRGDQTWVDEIMQENFCGRSTVDKEDFWQFIDLFEARFKEYLDNEFKKADADDSGMLSPSEMSSLLRKLGFTPAPWTVQELMLEMSEATGSQPGALRALSSNSQEHKNMSRRSIQCVGAGLNLEQFMMLNDLLLQRAGFTKSESMQFRAIFKRYDKSGDGEIDTGEIQTALSWSGFAFSEDMLEELIKEVDRDKSGAINQDEFLTLMRKHREIEIDTLKSAFSASDEDHSGTVDLEELPKVFEELNYQGALPEVFKDGIKACGLMPQNQGEFLFEDIWILLDWFRDRDGFSDADLAELKATFKRFDPDGKDRIRAMNLGNAIRWMGYPQTFEELMDVIEEFDIDDDVGVDQNEFRKIMRYYREQAVNRVRAKFKERDFDGSGSLSFAEMKQVLLHLGYTPCAKELKQMFEDLCGASKGDEVGLWEIEALVRGFKAEAREKFRKHHGFLENEVTKYKHEFDKYDPQRDGAIDNKDLRKLLAKLFPNAEDGNTNQKIREALKSVDGDGGDGQLDFDEYLGLMRHLQDEAEQKKLDREKDAVRNSRYSKKEVADFRSIYQSFDSDHSGEMDFEEFLIVMSAIMPPEIVNGAKMKGELKKMVTEVEGVDDNGAPAPLDFPGFLLVMRRIQDEDLGGINEILAATQSASA